jgi:type VI secretion system protein ImpC
MPSSGNRYKIIAFAPFGPAPDSDANTVLYDAALEIRDRLYEELGPRLYFPTSPELCPEGGITIEIRESGQFKPDRLVKATPYLTHFLEAAELVGNAHRNGEDPAQTASRLRENYSDLPDDLLTPPLASPEAPKEKAANVDDILAMVAMPDRAGSGGKATDWPSRIKNRLAEILSLIYENTEFQQYQASWLGLESLLRQGPVKESSNVELKVANLHPDGPDRALAHVMESLYSDPPNLILVDHPFDATEKSLNQVREIATFAENLMAPTICWITHRFFHINGWPDLAKISYLRHHLEDAAYAKWRKLAEESAASWLGLLCNRYVGRPAYGTDEQKETLFQESGPRMLGPVWAFGAVTAQSVLEYGWPTRFTDYVNCTLRDLPMVDLGSGEPTAAELPISEDRMAEFIEAGITPLVSPKRKDTAFFPRETAFGGASLKVQMFLCLVLGWLFEQQKARQSFEQGDLAESLKAGLTALFEKSGQPGPAVLEIKIMETRDDGSILMDVQLQPPHSMMAGAPELHFTFVW